MGGGGDSEVSWGAVIQDSWKGRWSRRRTIVGTGAPHGADGCCDDATHGGRAAQALPAVRRSAMTDVAQALPSSASAKVLKNSV
ncbi:hypothetical protein BCONGLO52_06550 [Brachybacterium conglomeratum]|uniref:Uncharacterized protein n=1 Tax=Brachybacterium conglomeratum TaxID=47846 RepID=A0ABQ5RFA3_9MICO|nr:hypothetical protein BCONGLO52_06550 [Brachybacterium conglomeratum]GLK05317.1 hypothetical protein GCM10017597_21170 [Brachybacterium conglomeratum]